jgi:hypothetical protein
VQLVNDIQTWIDRVFYYGSVAICVWAAIDCAVRKARAFTAANKLTKLAWLAILIVAGLIDYVIGGPLAGGPFGSIIGSAAVIAAMVYLFDVRPAVREVSGGGR